MRLPENVYKNISDNYYRYFMDNMIGTCSSSDSIKVAKSIIKLLDMEFKNGFMYDLTKTNKPYKPRKCPKFKITPFEFKRIDEDDLNVILNKNGGCAKELSPLFDCIGYNIRDNDGRLVLCFVGSPTYEMWKTLSYHDEDDTMFWKDIEDDFFNKDLKNIDWNKK